MKIVIPDNIDLPAEYNVELEKLGATIYHDIPDVETLKRRIADAEIVTANYVDITPDVIDAAPNLKYIIVPAVGHDWVDVEYAAKKGITTLDCPTHNGQAVAEHAVTLMLAANRQTTRGQDELRAGMWTPQDIVGYELGGKKVGLIGYGNIGTRIEKIISALGMPFSYVNSSSSQLDVDNLVRDSDFIVVCASLNPQTRNMIDERRFGLMKNTAVLVNVGRGAIVNQGALYQALKTNTIRGAGLDVYEGESLTGGPSKSIVDLAGLSNVVATPHIAYNTHEMQEKLAKELMDNINSCTKGHPQNVVSK